MPTSQATDLDEPPPSRGSWNGRRGTTARMSLAHVASLVVNVAGVASQVSCPPSPTRATDSRRRLRRSIIQTV